MRRLRFALGAVAGLLATGVVVAVAGLGDPETQTLGRPPTVVPYAGRLMIGGAPAEGTRALTFSLHRGADCADCELFRETQQVTFQGDGAFSVGLGTVEALPDLALTGGPWFLGIEVDGAPLAGRQAIQPTLFAHWAGTSGTLAPRGGVDLHGGELAGVTTLSGAGPVAVGGDLSATRLTARQADGSAEPIFATDGDDLVLGGQSGLQVGDLHLDEDVAVSGSVDLRVLNISRFQLTVNGVAYLDGAQRQLEFRAAGGPHEVTNVRVIQGGAEEMELRGGSAVLALHPGGAAGFRARPVAGGAFAAVVDGPLRADELRHAVAGPLRQVTAVLGGWADCGEYPVVGLAVFPNSVTVVCGVRQ